MVGSRREERLLGQVKVIGPRSRYRILFARGAPEPYVGPKLAWQAGNPLPTEVPLVASLTFTGEIVKAQPEFTLRTQEVRTTRSSEESKGSKDAMAIRSSEGSKEAMA